MQELNPMQISEKTLLKIAEMLCGSNGTPGGYHWPNFPYRSAPMLSEFFCCVGLPHRHTVGTRKYWVLEVLQKENLTTASNPQLPADTIILILQSLLDARTMEEATKDRTLAIQDVNSVLKWERLRAFVDQDGLAQIETHDSGAKSVGTLFEISRRWTEEEIRLRGQFEAFLDSGSEDQITEALLVPLFQHLGFQRISVAGHKDKRLEYGTDLWMKFTLPTKHGLFFGCQVKKDKIDATGKSDSNIAGILNQITMMLDHPIWDTQSNRKQLLDHIYIISGGEITKQAKHWLAERLDASKRRHIIFMDRSELLDLLVANRIPLSKRPSEVDDVPF
jgi:hypothetical protein